MLTNKQKLEYALQLKRLHEIMVVKENLYFAQSNANHNRAVKNLETLQDRIIENRINNHIEGNVDLINHKPIVDQVMNTALVNQRKGLSKTSNKKIDKLVDKNIKSYQEIMNNRLKLDAKTLDEKIERELQKKKYNNLSDNQLKHQLKEEFKGTTKKRINRIVGDALHTNQCNISFATAQEQGYKYKVWNNGRGKSRVRPWHRAKVINAVELDDKFYIYGSYPAYMMYPGDLNGGAENVANCRCWLSYTNITPSNLKTKGTIKIKDNVQLTKPNTVSTNKNTASSNKSLKTKVKESISSKVKTVINKVKNKFKIISKKLTPKNLKITSKNKLKINDYSNNKNKNSLKQLFDSNDQEYSLEKYNTTKNKKKFKKEIVDIVDPEDIDDIVNHIYSFINKELFNPEYEFASVRRHNKSLVRWITDWSKKGVTLPKWLEQEGIDKWIHTVIHNHPIKKIPLPSIDDISLVAQCGVKYLVVTNELGTFILKNNKIKKNKKNIVRTEKTPENSKTIEESMNYLYKIMRNDFKNHFSDWKKLDENKFNEKLEEFVIKNLDKYVVKYQNELIQHNMEVTFIKW